MLAAQALPPDVYINPHATRPLAAIAIPGRPGRAGVVFGRRRGMVPFSGATLADGSGPANSFYWGLALGAIGMYGIMRFLG